MKRFCELLREHPMKIFQKEKMRLLTTEQQESYENSKIIYIFLRIKLKINF